MDRPAQRPPTEGAHPGGGGARRSSLPMTAVVVVILALSAGWFVLSRFAEGTPAGDAASESVGVALGLLIVASVVGALAQRRRDRRRP